MENPDQALDDGMDVQESEPIESNPAEFLSDSNGRQTDASNTVEQSWRSSTGSPSHSNLEEGSEEGNEELNTPSTEHTEDIDEDLAHEERCEAQTREQKQTIDFAESVNADVGGASGENNLENNKRKHDNELAETPHSSVENSSNLKRSRLSTNDESENKDLRNRLHHASDKKKCPSREDKKGLADAVWDRLMDLQSGDDFRVAQVSRAALSSVGALPEYAQLTIIARFCRTPMKELRDKNGHLLALLKEYQKENPLVSQLQPASSYVDNFDLDAGLFEYGYAPPVPLSGMSKVPVPLQKEVESNEPKSRNHREERRETRETKPIRDEFGRNAIGSAGDSRRSHSRTDDDVVRASKPTDPRRRTQPPVNDQPRQTTPADPRRRNGASTGKVGQALRPSDRTDVYERLPRSIRDVFDKMYVEGRLREVINDSVLSRLLKLPEQVSLQAAENFSNVDLTNIDNVQGFLVGIINRVNERNLVAEAQESHHFSQQGRHGSYGSDRVNDRNDRGGSRFRPRQDNEAPNNFPSGAPHEQPMSYGQQQAPMPVQPRVYPRQIPERWPENSAHHEAISTLPASVQNHLHSMVENGTLTSIDEFGEKCYEVLGQLSEGLANEVLRRFTHANLGAVRNRSGFLIGVVKRCRQEYGFN